MRPVASDLNVQLEKPQPIHQVAQEMLKTMRVKNWSGMKLTTASNNPRAMTAITYATAPPITDSNTMSKTGRVYRMLLRVFIDKVFIFNYLYLFAPTSPEWLK